MFERKLHIVWYLRNNVPLREAQVKNGEQNKKITSEMYAPSFGLPDHLKFLQGHFVVCDY